MGRGGDVAYCNHIRTEESHCNESQGALRVFTVSKIHYNQITSHSRPPTGSYVCICSL